MGTCFRIMFKIMFKEYVLQSGDRQIYKLWNKQILCFVSRKAKVMVLVKTSMNWQIKSSIRWQSSVLLRRVLRRVPRRP